MNNKFKIILGLFASILVITGTIFKIMHLNGANILLFVGNISLVIAMFYLLKKTNNSHTN